MVRRWRCWRDEDVGGMVSGGWLGFEEGWEVGDGGDKAPVACTISLRLMLLCTTSSHTTYVILMNNPTSFLI